MNDINELLRAWAKQGEFSGWFDISNTPPINIHLLINIKDWGSAIGRLPENRDTFVCVLPSENSPLAMYVPICNVTHWAVIPEILKEE